MDFILANPHDPAVIEAPSAAVAVAAAMVMGKARFGIVDPNTGTALPEGGDLDAWFLREASMTFPAFLERNRDAVAAALTTVRLEGPRRCPGVDVAGRARFFAAGLQTSRED